jgi:hypothetical protein
MRLGACSHEKEVAELLARGYWPEASSDELRAHVSGCRSCQDLVLVRQTFRADRAAVSSVARLESPGVLWWRAQLSRRNAAMARISKPILGAQIFAFAVIIAAAILYVVSQTRSGFGWLAWFEQLPRAFRFGALLPDALQKNQGETWLVFSGIAMLVLMSGVVAYLASEKR